MSQCKSKFELETKDYKIITDTCFGGRKIQLFNSYDSEISEIISYYDVTGVTLSEGAGWQSQLLDFLTEINQLKFLCIRDSEIKDLSVIQKLVHLEVLYLECPKAKVSVDFSLLENLLDVRFDFRPCFSSIFESNTVETILVDGYKGEDLLPFKCESLARLDIVRSSKLTSLQGIENISSLKRLMLYQCSNLTDISHLQSVALERIEFETCKKLEELESLFKLSSLKNISLDKCGQLKGIRGVSKLELDSLIISDTVILDGDLTELLELKCSKLYFDDKKHYSHTLEYVRNTK